MREIKFRALYDHMGGGWKYGMLIYEGEVPRIQAKGTMLFATCLKGTEGQFTGLKDKNGKDIYEGDIVKGGTDFDKWVHKRVRTSVIEYHQHGFWIKDESFGWEGEELWSWEDLEVIGNIYETPEILK